MKKYIKKGSLFIIFILMAYFGYVFVGAMLTKYKPAAIEQISQIDGDFAIDTANSYSVLIWNIGYGGLGSEMDFFYDGGKQVRDSEDNVRRNIYKITQFLVANDSIDFILLQEVDDKSKRSYGINLIEHFNFALSEHFPFFAYNYKANYVPVPLFSPMGKVNSGLLSLSKHVPIETKRYSYPGNFSWPTNLFSPDRCFLSNTFMLNNQREFVLINTHNSAFDDGALRQQQMGFLRQFLRDEVGENKTFLVAGDWNQCPRGFTPSYQGHVFDTINMVLTPEDFLVDGWDFVYENKVPTNRRVVAPYVKGETYVTTIDYFLKSSAIEVQSIKTIDLDFANSDHQPVILSFKLN